MESRKDFTKNRQAMWRPLEERTYRYKKSAMEFFCPLCRTKRNFSINFRLSPMNFLQMILITALFTGLTYSWFGLRGSFIFFILWPIFEFTRRALYKKEIPCPHCGFDASWYKRDVKVARQLVSDFWTDTSEESQAARQAHQDEAVLQELAKDQNSTSSSAYF